MATTMPDTKLSTNDARILNALFDPETLPSSEAKLKNTTVIDSNLPSHPTIAASQLSLLEEQQNTIVQRVSSATDASGVETALVEMDIIIQQWSNYPSAFVNRAMLRRMQLELTTKGKNIFNSDDKDIEMLFRDLGRAIHTSLPPSSPTAAVSPFQARILRTAYSHRAYLYLKAAESGVSLNGREKGELEELASYDFEAAARYGDEVAKEMSVRTNPYAKMCGAIVKNALAEERKTMVG